MAFAVVSSFMVCLLLRKSIASKCTIVFAFSWKMQWSDLNELYILGDDMASKRLDFYRAHMIVLFDIGIFFDIVCSTRNNLCGISGLFIQSKVGMY